MIHKGKILLKKSAGVALMILLAGASVAAAALTFTGTAMTGDAGTTIDVGSGNTLSIQTTANGPITTGSGLLTVAGLMSFTSASGTNLGLNAVSSSYVSSTNVTVGGSFQSNAGQNTIGNASTTNLDVATRFNFAAASSTGNLTVGGLFQAAVTSTFSGNAVVRAHVNATGTSPGTPTTCGTSPSVIGTDNAFRVTVGTLASAATSCTIPFATAFRSKPVCVIANTNTSTPLFYQVSSTISNVSIMSLDVQTSTIALKNMAQVVFDVLCLGID